MKLTTAVPVGLAAMLALSGCASQPAMTPVAGPVAAPGRVVAQPPATGTGSAQYPSAVGPGTPVLANPPDNPTGSAAYQSPDLDGAGAATQARTPRRGTGSQRYQTYR